MTHSTLLSVLENIKARSKETREHYLTRQFSDKNHIKKGHLGCTNMAHACAAMPNDDKENYIEDMPNIGIISSYNDMLSAHQPFEKYPDIIREAARKHKMTAQFSGGVPAMCDGVTQGEDGMELSLISRDVIAQSAAIGLSHQTYDGVVYLGVCDKIIPGLFMAAATFGHLPSVFIPAGPMPSGISNDEKVKTRNLFAEGKATKKELLKSELKSYHSPGTCTFYGTANSNQILMEVAGLHLPHTTFLQPETPERKESIFNNIETLSDLIKDKKSFAHIVCEKTIINMIIALLATGGSTNHTIHLIAMAKSAGIIINWDDFSALSEVIPLVTKVYPNGPADINAFHEAGSVGYVVKTLLKGGLLFDDVQTIIGDSLSDYASKLEQSKDNEIIRDFDTPFAKTGGVSVLDGNVGRGVSKISAVKEDKRYVKAPAKVVYSQEEFKEAFQKGELNRDVIIVLPYQGPRANGMPELHKLVPSLSVLQNRGFNVGLITDGRMSGASGKVSSAIHISPEAAMGGQIGKISDGDMITLDPENGILTVESEFKNEKIMTHDHYGCGREIFEFQRKIMTTAEEGATFLQL